jgi:hypothetical protein
VMLGALSLQGGAGGSGANLFGTSGRLTISTAGNIRVTGAVSLAGATAGNVLELSAGQILLDDSSGGALRVSGANAATPEGILQLSANDIWSGDTSLLGQLGSNAAFAGRDAALGTAPQVPLDGPVLAGGTLRFSVGRSLLIKNTGNARDRAGFSAGSGGIQVTALSGDSTTPLDLVINGRALSDVGSPLINQFTVGAFTFNGGQANRTLSATASINGCLIGGGMCSIFVSDPVIMASMQAATEPEQLSELAEEERKRATEAVTEADKKPEIRMSRLIEGAIVNNDDVIDEPVSGSGNPGLWSPQVPIGGDQ